MKFTVHTNFTVRIDDDENKNNNNNNKKALRNSLAGAIYSCGYKFQREGVEGQYRESSTHFNRGT
jgi:hypothetical protein